MRKLIWQLQYTIRLRRLADYSFKSAWEYANDAIDYYYDGYSAADAINEELSYYE